LSGGRSSRGSGMRCSVMTPSWVRLLVGGRGDLLERRPVAADLDFVDFVPREAEALELTLERGLISGLVHRHDEAGEHVDVHVLELGVRALQNRRGIRLEFLSRQARRSVNGDKACHF